MCVFLCLPRESAGQWSQREAQHCSCCRLPHCAGHLHCCNLPAASQGFATWSQDPLSELGTQNLKVPWALLCAWTESDLPYRLWNNLPSSLGLSVVHTCLTPSPYSKWHSYRVTDYQTSHPGKKNHQEAVCFLLLTFTLSYCRFHNVYCAYVASSCVTILSLPASHQLFTSRWVQVLFLPFSVLRRIFLFQVSRCPVSSSCAGRASSPSLVFISNLQHQLQALPQARILCHVSCVLTLSLQWVCSLCSSIFKEVWKLPERTWQEACRLSTRMSYATM